MGKLGKKLKRSRVEAATELAAPAPGASAQPVDAAALAALLTALVASGLPHYHSAPLRPLRAMLYPLLQAELQSGVHFEPPPPAAAAPAAALPPPPPLLTLQEAAPLLALCGRADALQQLQAHKELRRALHPLVVDLGAREGLRSSEASLPAAISAALRRRDWAGALARLRELRAARGCEAAATKLGSLQRWVNAVDVALGEGDAGEEGAGGGASEGASAAAAGAAGAAGAAAAGAAAAATERAAQLLVLDSILRVSAGMPYAAAEAPAGAASGVAARLVRHPLWRCPAAAAREGPPTAAAPLPPPAPAPIAASIVHTIPSAQRRPPCPTDLHVYASPPAALTLAGAAAAAAAGSGAAAPTPTPSLPVPGVPGARLLPGALTPAECAAMIALLEGIGYAQDAVPGIECVHLLADKRSLLEPLFHRLAAAPGFLPPHLPSTRASATGSATGSASGSASAGSFPPAQLVGINARWRCFRYSSGVTYKAHIDGAWPGAGLCSDSGAFVEDVHSGSALSRFTLLLYLNEGFSGGGTTFFLPSQAEGVMEARGVEPSVGCALIFPHGEAAGSLVHEGSAVARGGCKYIVRSDVLYTTAGGGAGGGR